MTVAIQPDVTTVPPVKPEATPGPMANRAAMMEAIADEDMQSRNDYATDHGYTAPYVAAAEPTPAEPELPAATPVVPAATEPAAEKMVRVKIEGVEREVPEAELIREYQKGRTADKRLNDLAIQRRELEAWEESLKAKDTAVTPAAHAPASDLDLENEAKRVMTLVFEGEQETAAKELAALLKRQATPSPAPQQVDPAAIAAEVSQKLESKSEWETFVSEHPEFAHEGTPQRDYGDFVFMSKYNARVQTGDMSYQEALKQTAAEVRAIFSPPPPVVPVVPTPEPTPTVTVPAAVDERAARKAAIDNLPAAVARAGAETEVDVAETHESIIAELRKSRGLPV